MARGQARGAAVSDFRPAQAAASMTAPWDPGWKFGAMSGGGRRKIAARKGSSNPPIWHLLQAVKASVTAAYRGMTSLETA